MVSCYQACGVSCYQAWDYRAIRRADRPQTRASIGFARPLTSLT
ncbi:hypothetical protein STPYR_10795 [uncultured Stenotrophomonas sp.]|uniref:Uncharacterized protein n=1 Tax=uncultured Stenotrophomonas sp. TaxID=165438 RepID=A0A1Y5Q525_9GAMM|nr:hypothetical protein STPYR_10795 [uncultured Stenotrophomonas sp.]